jgi:hypothetical protein
MGNAVPRYLEMASSPAHQKEICLFRLLSDLKLCSHFETRNPFNLQFPPNAPYNLVWDKLLEQKPAQQYI